MKDSKTIKKHQVLTIMSNKNCCHFVAITCCMKYNISGIALKRQIRLVFFRIIR